MANVYYRTYDHTVYALNPTTGAVRWSFSRGQGINTPVAAGNRVYVQTIGQTSGQPDTLYALDSATGAVVWSTRGGTPPVIADGALYLIVDQTLFCLDAATGAVRWRQQNQNGHVTVSGDTLLVVGGKPIASTGDPITFTISAIDRASGAVRWSHTSDQEAFTDPIVHDGVVYFASHLLGAAQLNALKLSDGAQIWRAPAPLSANNFALGASVLVAGGTSSGIAAYRTSDGTQLWKNSDAALGAFTVVGNTVYSDTFHCSVLALSVTTGAQQWETKLPRLDSTPIVDHDLLYMTAGRGDGTALALKIQTGEIAWQIPIAGTPGSVLLSDGVFYTASSQPDNGPRPVVYALNPSTGATVWTHETDQNLETILVAPDGLSGCPNCH